MAWITRKSETEISSSAIILASSLNAEFDGTISGVSAAFHVSTGHNHDGTTDQGPQLNFFSAISNVTKSAASPDADSDSSAGFEPGSLWYNTSADNYHWCQDSTSGAAVWHEFASVSATMRSAKSLGGTSLLFGTPVSAGALQLKGLSVSGNGLSISAATSSVQIAMEFSGIDITGVTYKDSAERGFNHGTLSSTALACDFRDGNVHFVRVSGDISAGPVNFPVSGDLGILFLRLENAGSHTVTWNSGIVWDGGVTPTFQTSGIDWVAFLGDDAGVTVRALRVWKEA